MLPSDRSGKAWYTSGRSPVGSPFAVYDHAPCSSGVVCIDAISFGTKEALSMRFGQLAELRNAIRHSRDVTTIMRNDGEAALGWFREALAVAQVTATTESVTSPEP